VSPPVLSGFVSASALTIAVGQVRGLLGLPRIGRMVPQAVPGIFRNIQHTQWPDASLGVACICLVLLFKVLGVRGWRQGTTSFLPQFGKHDHE